ncbi:hypothetical protein P280DRAFT_482964 [Massarina eburnea CBS 473.64]|uniref:DUF2418 domain-containing protein n=1 Tax=Massarina eburnea CBS 473.64 TaxID=1395130 RepID=A0A6A6RSB4_9PLEO|nr:hypothetical protein P280DRAFT_482964 [Massarina eburnea CBS 473.64]
MLVYEQNRNVLALGHETVEGGLDVCVLRLGVYDEEVLLRVWRGGDMLGISSVGSNRPGTPRLGYGVNPGLAPTAQLSFLRPSHPTSTAAMPRLVRRAPLAERIKAVLDLHDWIMWAGEELNTNDWEDFARDYSLVLGFGVNFVFTIAQANASGSSDGDDVLVGTGGGGWFSWFCKIIVLVLSGLAFLNAYTTFSRKRHYRLFEQSIETGPVTPSAKRVRVDSSPAAGSPLRFIQNLISSASADSRAHPDAGRDVWEIAVWDPNPLCLEMFCLFSPLHVVLYCLTLPVATLDPQPSVKIFTTIVIGAVLSFQMRYLRSSFSQQIKDNSIIQKEVLHEYDNKFVHPSTQKVCRDVGIQTISRKKTRDASVGVRGSSSDLASEVVTYTPTTIITRTFRTKPNQSYASQYDPDNLSRSSSQTPSRYSNSKYTSATTGTGADLSSPIRPSNTPNPFHQQPSLRRPSGDGGGSLGVYTHANSPLRKSSSSNFIRDDRGRESLGGQGERRHGQGTSRREGSPLKRVSMFDAAVGSGSDRPSAAAERLGRYGGTGVSRRESGRF